MKRIIAIIVLLTLALAGTAVATDSTCVVEKHEGYLTGTGYVKVTLTANSATGGFIDVANTITHANMKGIVEYATVEPGTVTPTTGTDISLWSSTGKSLFGDTGRTAVPSNDGQLSDLTFLTTAETLNVNRPAHGSTTIQVRGNSVNSAVIVLYIYYSSEGFSGVSEPLDVTASGGSLAVTLDEPIAVTSSDSEPVTFTETTSTATIVFTAQAVGANSEYTSTTFDLSKVKGSFSLQAAVTGDGTCSIKYFVSNNGTDFLIPVTGEASESDIFAGLTKTSGYKHDGKVIDDFLPEFAKYLQIAIWETGGAEVTVTATLLHR